MSTPFLRGREIKSWLAMGGILKTPGRRTLQVVIIANEWGMSQTYLFQGHFIATARNYLLESLKTPGKVTVSLSSRNISSSRSQIAFAQEAKSDHVQYSFTEVH